MKTLTEHNDSLLNSVLNGLNENTRYISKKQEEDLCKQYNLKRVFIGLDRVGYYQLDIIESNGKGCGTQFMKALCNWADEYHKTLTLSPTDVFVGKKNLKRLENFYMQFGFVKNSGRYTDFKTHQKMIRLSK